MGHRTQKPIIIFFIIGVLLLALSFFVGRLWDKQFSFGEYGSAALSSTAFVLLTIVIVNYLWGILGGEPVQQTLSDLQRSSALLQDSHTTGLRRIVYPSGEFANHGEWMNRLKSAEHNVDLMGLTLRAWGQGENFEDEVVKLVKGGVTVRVMIMDAQNPHLASIINSQVGGLNEYTVRRDAEETTKVFERITEGASKVNNTGTGGSFELRLVQTGTILCQLCRTDSSIVAIPYLYSDKTSVSPLMLIEGQDSRLFKAYMKEFEKLWESNVAKA